MYKYLKREDGDCLSKTQDLAKFNNDVLGLTPAQCFKVKNYKLCLLV